MAELETGENPVRIQGEWSIRNAGELRRLFAASLEAASQVMLDLGGVGRCDAAALQLIYSSHKTAAGSGQELHIVALSPAIEETAAALGVPIQDLVHAAHAGASEGDSCGA